MAKHLQLLPMKQFIKRKILTNFQMVRKKLSSTLNIKLIKRRCNSIQPNIKNRINHTKIWERVKNQEKYQKIIVIKKKIAKNNIINIKLNHKQSIYLRNLFQRKKSPIKLLQFIKKLNKKIKLNKLHLILKLYSRIRRKRMSFNRDK